MLHAFRSRRTERHLWIAAVAATVLFAFPYHYYINNPNENVRLYMTAAVVDDHTYAIDQVRGRWGWVNDAACVDKLPNGKHIACNDMAGRDVAGKVERHYYSVKAPGTSWLGIPAYAAFRALHPAPPSLAKGALMMWYLRAFGIALPLLLLGYVFFRELERSSTDPALAGVIFAATFAGSLLYAYSLIFVSHALAAASAFASFAMLRRARASNLSLATAATAGFCAAMVTGLEYYGLWASLLLTILATIRLSFTRVLAFGLGAAAPTAGVMHFQWSAFGSPFKPGHIFAETETFRQWHSQGVYGVGKFSLDSLGTLLFDEGYGLFLTTPVLLLAAFSFFRFRDRRLRTDLTFAWLIIAGTVFLIASTPNWRGGWTIGPRLISIVVPFLAWLVALAAPQVSWPTDRVTRATEYVWRTLLVALCIISVLSSNPLAAYYPHVPEEIQRPLAELVRALVNAGLVPDSPFRAVGGVSASRGAVPYAVGLLVLVALVLTLPTARLVRGARRATVFTALLLTFGAGAWLLRPFKPTDGGTGAVRFVIDNYQPRE